VSTKYKGIICGAVVSNLGNKFHDVHAKHMSKTLKSADYRPRIVAIIIAIVTGLIFYWLTAMVGLTETVMVLLYPPVLIILWLSLVVVPYKRTEVANETIYVWSMIIIFLLTWVFPLLLYVFLVSIPKAWLQYLSGWLLYGYQASANSINTELTCIHNYSMGSVQGDFTKSIGLFLFSHFPYVFVFYNLAWLLAWAAYSLMKRYGMQDNGLIAFLIGVCIYLALFALFKIALAI
jgi:hypothetical protein